MIKIINKAYETVALLNPHGSMGKNIPYFDDEYHQNLNNGSETLRFKTFGGTKQAKHLVIGNYIAYTDFDGIIKLFQIIEVTENHSSDEYTIEVYCEMASIELINEIVRPMTVVNSNLKSFLQTILQESDWEVGLFPENDFHEIIDFEVTEYTTIYSCIEEYVIQKYGGEVDYRIEFVNNKIAHKYIDIYKERGRKYEKLFYYSKNMSSVTKKVDSSNIATALIGVGRNNITFKDVSASDKPLNQDFIENKTAYAKWNVGGSHIMGVFRYETDSPSELLIMTRKELAKRAEPQITYELATELLDKNIHLGSYVGVVDHELDIYVNARVTELITSKTDSTKNVCVLSNFKEVRTKITDFTMNDVINNIKDYLARLETGILTQNAIDNIKRYLTELKLTKQEIDDLFKKLNLPNEGQPEPPAPPTDNDFWSGDDLEGEDKDGVEEETPVKPPVSTIQDKICEKARDIVKLCDNSKAWYSQWYRTIDYRNPKKITSSGESSYLKNHIGKLGWDCSSFVGCCYDYAGIPDLVDKACSSGTLIQALNKKNAIYWKYTDDKNLTKARAGDVIMFANSSVTNVSDLSTLTAWNKTHHTAIYLGNGKVAHARTYSKGIAITDVSTTLNNTAFFARIKDLQNVSTDGGTTGGSTGSIGGTTGGTTGGIVEIDGSVETTMWNYLIEKGYSKQCTASIMGNAYRESAMLPTAGNTKGTSYGLFQWMHERKTALENYARQKGVSVSNARLQVEFMDYEISGGEPYTAGLFKKRYGSLENFKKLTDITEATYGFERCFERANETENGYSKRYKFAQDYYNKYANQSSSNVNAITGTTKTIALVTGKTYSCETLSSLTFTLPTTVTSSFNSKLIFTTPVNADPMKIKHGANCWLKGSDCINGALIPQANTRYTIEFKKNTSSSILLDYVGTVTKVSYGGSYKSHGGFTNATKLIELAQSYYDVRSKFKYNTTTPISPFASGTPKSNKSKWYTGGKYHIDCSTFVNQLYKGRGYSNSIYANIDYTVGKSTLYSWGVDLGRYASTQAQTCMENGWYLADIKSKSDWSKLKKGDIVFWGNRSGDANRADTVAKRFMQVGHVAIVGSVNGTDVTTYEVSTPTGVILKRKLADNTPDKILFFARVRK